MAQPDPARVHAAMVLAFAERERRPEDEVRDLLFEKGYTAEEIMTALANLPPLPRGFKPPPPRTRPLPAPAAKPKLPEPPKSAPPVPKLEPKAEPAKAEAPKTEPVKPEPAKTEPAKAEPPKTEAVRTETPKAEDAKSAETGKLPPPKEKPALLPLPPGSSKAPPKQAKRGKPTQGAWLFAAASGLLLLVLILAFSCGRTPPEPGENIQPTGSAPATQPSPSIP